MLDSNNKTIYKENKTNHKGSTIKTTNIGIPLYVKISVDNNNSISKFETWLPQLVDHVS